MLDAFARLATKRWVYVVTAILVAAVVVGPRLAGDGNGDAASQPAPSTTTTTDGYLGAPSTSESGPATTGDGMPTTTAPEQPTTVPGGATTPEGSVVPTDTAAEPVEPAASADTTTTMATTTTAVPEIARAGDQPNPGRLYSGRPDQRVNDQERLVGRTEEPARLSGYSAWVPQVTFEQAGPDGRLGSWVRVWVYLINRDEAEQAFSDRQWLLTRADGVVERSSYATPAFAAGTGKMPGHGDAWGELWFAWPTAGRAWLAFRPDQGSARGVWAIEPPPTAATAPEGVATTTTSPP